MPLFLNWYVGIFLQKKHIFCQLVIDNILQLCYIITMNRRAVEELKMKTLQEQLNEWKARRAEAENEMGEALKENDERKYKCALFDYRNADHQVTSVLECIAMNK